MVTWLVYLSLQWWHYSDSFVISSGVNAGLFRLHLSCSTFPLNMCSSPMLFGSFTMECIWGTGLMDHCLTSDICSAQRPRHLTEWFWKHYLQMTVPLMAHKESDLQLIVDKFVEASLLFGLTISLGKTEVLLQPSPGIHCPFTFNFCWGYNTEDSGRAQVSWKYYLQWWLAWQRDQCQDLQSQSSPLMPACTWILNQHNIQQSTKPKVYKAIVLTSLLYGCETWTLYRKHLKIFEHFHIYSLRSILKIRWQDKDTNLVILDWAETTSIEAMILKAQPHWTAHVLQMDTQE